MLTATTEPIGRRRPDPRTLTPLPLKMPLAPPLAGFAPPGPPIARAAAAGAVAWIAREGRGGAPPHASCERMKASRPIDAPW